MNLPSPLFQLIPARGLKFRVGFRMMFFAAVGEEHQAGALEVPQKNCQLVRSARLARLPRISPKAGTRSYALLLTLPAALDRIGTTAYT